MLKVSLMPLFRWFETRNEVFAPEQPARPPEDFWGFIAYYAWPFRWMIAACAVAGGVLATGDEMPSIRSLSVPLGVNPMTISKAYSYLERDEVVIGLIPSSEESDRVDGSSSPGSAWKPPIARSPSACARAAARRTFCSHSVSSALFDAALISPARTPLSPMPSVSSPRKRATHWSSLRERAGSGV